MTNRLVGSYGSAMDFTLQFALTGPVKLAAFRLMRARVIDSTELVSFFLNFTQSVLDVISRPAAEPSGDPFGDRFDRNPWALSVAVIIKLHVLTNPDVHRGRRKLMGSRIHLNHPSGGLSGLPRDCDQGSQPFRLR